MNIPDLIIRYSDGTEAKVGDTVLIDEKQQGVVLEIVDTKEKMKRWDLNEYGLMFDRVFYPERFLREYPVDIISRAVA